MSSRGILRRCKFCGKEIKPAEGIMYVKSDGTIWYFCSSKCRKNMIELRRNPKKFKWASV